MNYPEKVHMLFIYLECQKNMHVMHHKLILNVTHNTNIDTLGFLNEK